MTKELLYVSRLDTRSITFSHKEILTEPAWWERLKPAMGVIVLTLLKDQVDTLVGMYNCRRLSPDQTFEYNSRINSQHISRLPAQNTIAVMYMYSLCKATITSD
jgi:hypothetical protein